MLGDGGFYGPPARLKTSSLRMTQHSKRWQGCTALSVLSDIHDFPSPASVHSESAVMLPYGRAYLVHTFAWLDSGHERKGTQFRSAHPKELGSHTVKQLRGSTSPTRHRSNGCSHSAWGHGSKSWPFSPTSIGTCVSIPTRTAKALRGLILPQSLRSRRGPSC